jgi:hypothetical protein
MGPGGFPGGIIPGDAPEVKGAGDACTARTKRPVAWASEKCIGNR